MLFFFGIKIPWRVIVREGHWGQDSINHTVAPLFPFPSFTRTICQTKRGEGVSVAFFARYRPMRRLGCCCWANAAWMGLVVATLAVTVAGSGAAGQPIAVSTIRPDGARRASAVTADAGCDFPLHPADLAALRALYNATGGTMWRRADGGWRTANDSVAACDAYWEGVNFTNRHDCSGGGRGGMFPCALVDNVTLVNNNLVGSLPGGLTFQALGRLKIVDSPGLTGEVPWCDWVAQPFITSLKSLTLANNGHTGPLPQDLATDGGRNCSLASFSQLFEINLASNGFSGPCNSTSWPPRLQRLVVWANNFSGPVPNETIGNLTAIDTIDLGANGFSGPFPAGWAKANATLTKITLAENPDVGGPLPDNMGGLLKLVIAYLDTCSFTGNLPSMSRMTALSVLTLGSNQLRGTLPSDWGGQAPSLTDGGGGREVEGGGMLALSSLSLSSNPGLQGVIPPSWAQLSGLSSFDISYTAVEGSFQPFSMWRPTVINVAHTKMRCCFVPPTWTESLQSLRFAGTTVTQDEWLPANRMWPSLQHIILDDVVVPRGVAASLLLGSIVVTGMAPSLSVFSLRGVKLTGPRPINDLCLWPSIRVVDISGNAFASAPTLTRNCPGNADELPLQLVDVTPLRPVADAGIHEDHLGGTLNISALCPEPWYPQGNDCLSPETAYRATNTKDIVPKTESNHEQAGEGDGAGASAAAIRKYILQGQLISTGITFTYDNVSSNIVVTLIFHDQLGGVVMLLTPRIVIWVTPTLQILPNIDPPHATSSAETTPLPTRSNSSSSPSVATCPDTTTLPAWHGQPILYTSRGGDAGTMTMEFNASTLLGGCGYRLWFSIYAVDRGLPDSPLRWSDDTVCPCPPVQNFSIAGPRFTHVCGSLLAALPMQQGCTECPALGQCDGTINVTTTKSAWRPSLFTGFRSCDSHHVGCQNETKRSGTSCNDGYSGVMCSNCDKRYYRAGRNCSECPNTATSNVLIVGCFLLVCVFLFLAVYVSVMSCARRGQAAQPTNAVRRWMQRTSRVMPCIKLLLNQLAFVAILFRCKATASMTSGTLSIVAPIQQQIARLGMLSLLPCVVTAYESYFDGLVYASLAVALCIVYVPIYSRFGPTYRFKWLTVIVTVFQIYYFSIVDATAQTLFAHSVALPPLAKQSVAMRLRNETLRLYGNSTTIWYVPGTMLPGSPQPIHGPAFGLMIFVFVIVGVVFLLMALLTFYVLERTDTNWSSHPIRRKDATLPRIPSDASSMSSRLYPPGSPESATDDSETASRPPAILVGYGSPRSAPTTSESVRHRDVGDATSDGKYGPKGESSFSLAQTVFFFIVQNYKCDHWYWDFLFSARKLVCVVIAAAPLDAMPQLLLFLAASFGYLAVVLWQKPYLSKWLFRADIAASTCLVLSVAVASFSGSLTDNGGSAQSDRVVFVDGADETESHSRWTTYTFVVTHLSGVLLMLAGFVCHVRDAAAGKVGRLYGRRRPAAQGCPDSPSDGDVSPSMHPTDDPSHGPLNASTFENPKRNSVAPPAERSSATRLSSSGPTAEHSSTTSLRHSRKPSNDDDDDDDDGGGSDPDGDEYHPADVYGRRRLPPRRSGAKMPLRRHHHAEGGALVASYSSFEHEGPHGPRRGAPRSSGGLVGSLRSFMNRLPESQILQADPELFGSP